jgi:hypothetical protein
MMSLDMKSEANSVALVVTSCGRIDLLEKTLISFSRYNTFPIAQVVLVEDSGYKISVEWLSGILSVAVDLITVITNSKNLGQFKSIDLAYSCVESKFIFHLEDDWVFYNSGFIEYSLEILDADEMVSCVWLRAHDDTNSHPIQSDVYKTINDYSYRLMDTCYLGRWSGFTFNPGLRRTETMLRFSPFCDQELYDKKLGSKRSITESDLSILFGKHGYRAAIPDKSDGYVRHIGYSHHIAQPFESKFRVFLRNLYYRIKSFNV